MLIRRTYRNKIQSSVCYWTRNNTYRFDKHQYRARDDANNKKHESSEYRNIFENSQQRTWTVSDNAYGERKLPIDNTTDYQSNQINNKSTINQQEINQTDVDVDVESSNAH